jgi:hypothetical protein
MSRWRVVLVIAAGLAVSGCCIGSGCYTQPATHVLTSWDGLGRAPVPKEVKRIKGPKIREAAASEDTSPREEELSRLRPYSREWTAAFNAINAAADAKLKEKLIICQGCMPREPDDLTSSIGAAGYLPVRQ